MTGKKHIAQLLAMVFLMMCLFGNNLFAEDQEVLLEINDDTIQIGVSTTLSLVLRNVSGKAELVDFEGLDNFEVVSQSQSSSTKNINGTSSKETAVNFTIMPKEVGTFNLKAVLKIDGITYETNSLTVDVTEMNDDVSQATEDIFIRTIPSSDEIYFGQNLVITYELYSRYQVDDYGFTDDVNSDGFIVNRNEDLEHKPNYLEISGNKYVMYTVDQLVMRATNPGDYTIQPFEFQANLSTGDFFGTSKPSYLTTDEVKVKVLPLPAKGQPSGFKGLIGDLQVNYEYSDTVVEGNNPLTLTVSVEGDGNLYTLTSVADLMDLKDFTVYETEKERSSSLSSEKYKEKVTFEIILVPKASGTFDIPNVDIPYFDTTSKRYNNLSIMGESITVNGVRSSGVESGSSTIVENSTPILVNQVVVTDMPKDVIWFVTKGQIIATVSALLLLIMGITVYIYTKNSRTERQMTHYSKAIKKAKSESDLQIILEKFIYEQTKLKISSSTQERILACVSSDKAEKVRNVLDYFEHVRKREQKSLGDVKSMLLSVVK